MAIVARGLGQPEGGAVVAEGLGAAADDGVRWLSATIAGTSTLTAAASVVATVQPGGGGRRRGRVTFIGPPQPVPAWMSATLRGSSTLTATAEAVMDFDAELEQLMLIGAL